MNIPYFIDFRDQIEKNNKKTIVLFSVFFIFMLITGGIIGIIIHFTSLIWSGGFYGTIDLEIAAIVGAMFMGLLAVFSMIRAIFGKEKVLLGWTQAYLLPDDYYLYDILDGLKIAGGVQSSHIKLGMMDSNSINAFAIGDTESGLIIVTKGLLEQLKKDEIEGVLAHELSHILSKDTKIMTLAAVMTGTAIAIPEFFFRLLELLFEGKTSKTTTTHTSYTPRRKSKGSGSGGGGSAIIAIIFFLLAMSVLYLLTSFVNSVTHASISRKREYIADANAVRLTRYPDGLKNALLKILATDQYDMPARLDKMEPLFITSPTTRIRPLQKMFDTHPSLEERIRLLDAM